MAELMQPRVNLNGTDRAQLVQARCDLREAIRKAMETVGAIQPNGRDYIGAPAGSYDRDLAIYRRRFAVLDALYSEIGDEALAILTRIDGEA